METFVATDLEKDSDECPTQAEKGRGQCPSMWHRCVALKKKIRSPKWHFFVKSWTGKGVSREIGTASTMGEDVKLPLSGSIWEPL